jgi:CBS domain-containing protein
MKVCDLLTSEVVTVTPTTSLRDAAALLTEKGISGMPVVNDSTEVVGVLSEADIVVKAGGEVACPAGFSRPTSSWRTRSEPRPSVTR